MRPALIVRAPTALQLVLEQVRQERLDARPRRRKSKVPSNAARRGKAVHPPVAIEHFLAGGSGRLAKAASMAALRVLLPRIADFAAPPPEERLDAKHHRRPRGLRRLMREAREAAAKQFEASASESLADMAGRRTLAYSDREMKRLGIPAKEDPTLKPLVSGWARDHAQKIKGMQDEQLDKVEDLLTFGANRRHESLAEDIREQLEDVSESRARSIARDSVLTLNGKITHHRHKKAGINSYIWTTAGDDKVREEHALLDGQEFSWDDPPEPGHPGEDYNCRCVAYPVIPELED